MKAFGAPVMSATLLVAPAAIHSGADGDGCVLGSVIVGAGDGGATASRSVAPQPAPNKTRTAPAMKKIAARFLIPHLHAGNQANIIRGSAFRRSGLIPGLPPECGTPNFFIFVPAGNLPAATSRIRRRAGERCDNRVGSILAPHWRLTLRAVRCSR